MNGGCDSEGDDGMGRLGTRLIGNEDEDVDKNKNENDTIFAFIAQAGFSLYNATRCCDISKDEYSIPIFRK